MTFPMKNSVLDNLPPCTPAHPPPKSANFIFIVVSLSLKVLTLHSKLQPWMAGVLADLLLQIVSRDPVVIFPLPSAKFCRHRL